MKTHASKTTNVINIYYITFVASLIGFLLLLFDYGFNQEIKYQIYLNVYYFLVLILGIIATGFRYFWQKNSKTVAIKLFDVLSTLIIIYILIMHLIFLNNHQNYSIFYNNIWVKVAILLTFIREFSELRIVYKRTIINPAQLFIISFLAMILIGSLLLQLPNATNGGIGFVDALFTATSAICVTGLAVVDTGTHFTQFGQIILMLLIQIGGLGILTFASYFSYFFKGGSSYENQLVLSDMTNTEKMSDVFSSFKRIIFITFSIELVGAFFIYASVSQKLFSSTYSHAFFAIFHSISGFCNAGFSTLANGYFDDNFKFNYSLEIITFLLFALGGLGFPIVINLLKFLKHFILSLIMSKNDRRTQHKPWLINITSRITLITTISLTVFGTLALYFLEYNNTLAEHHGIGKLIAALFEAATPRTAGFNNVDMAKLGLPAIMITVLLMWIGASPASTGGGIKTSTFAIATLNFVSLAKGKTRIEVFRREIADLSVRRALGTISLSLIIIGLGIMLISLFDKDFNILGIGFECFSAYSTVGLSLGLTTKFSVASKFVLIALMFIGRVSMLSILIAVFKKSKYTNYRYPTEEILIN